MSSREESIDNTVLGIQPRPSPGYELLLGTSHANIGHSKILIHIMILEL